MQINEDIRPITYLKSKSPDLLRQVNTTKRPVIITQNGEPRGILQDPESYSRMRDALSLLKLINQSELEIRNGKTVRHGNLMSELHDLIAGGNGDQ
ncbi:MAG TPA: type II toxin-antitoxin system Phd/YefM family antitoxin [Candidatus Marinimicrobia bacterium]|jgi:prevent-host-death family protein|nr:MAG: prevent-host-death protein [Candidatus Marinimicrobia bacterium CG1_02_48_14]PIZ66573.1 MAG: type II toxin-antitoxin system Phd/YefM family antitoxin [Candidatus Marinimicrobia bacterium CG_4_10_14_0_2_um_filter_48_9]PJA53984.1 MAG: type II toxin-antitoxin system Phd/YefM family antitoxin [Candidatus Marinimicrobia bacterium CG_4_9_14_3_um_filter_48_9]HCW75020.1 type II toxin-antitoxin system Phd/YefM family antitoxin [Candidatus Neomarinimicrobiota bacterium]